MLSQNRPRSGQLRAFDDGLQTVPPPSLPVPHLPERRVSLGDRKTQVVLEEEGDLIQDEVGYPKGYLGLLHGQRVGGVAEVIVQSHVLIGEMDDAPGDALVDVRRCSKMPAKRHVLSENVSWLFTDVRVGWCTTGVQGLKVAASAQAYSRISQLRVTSGSPGGPEEPAKPY